MLSLCFVIFLKKDGSNLAVGINSEDNNPFLKKKHHIKLAEKTYIYMMICENLYYYIRVKDKAPFNVKMGNVISV
jgi:hypothetical protein